MGKGSRRRSGGGGGGGRGRGPASANDTQRLAANLIDAAARRGLQVTDVGFGRYPPQMQFLMACNDGDVDRLKAVVDSMDEDDRESLASVRFEDFGALHSAASSGNMAICKYLVEQLGFDVNSDATNRGSGDDDWKARLKSNGAKAVKGKDHAAAFKFHTGDDRKARLKANGAKAVEGKDYAAASKFYTEAIKLDPADGVLYSNRSLCYLKCGEEHDALDDANACIALKPKWHKGYYRKGAALMSLLEFKEASDAFLAGMKLAPGNKEMKEAFWEAVEAVKKEDSEPSLYELD